MDVKITGTTRLLGIIGDPIAQARTPEAINPIFAAKGANIVCIPFHVPVDNLETCWAGLTAMPNLIGIAVTLPHKKSVLALCDSLDPLAEQVGALNLIRREADGLFRGYQFDGPGFLHGLTHAGIKVIDRSCLMIGAGGAAVGIAFALAKAGAGEIIVSNRTHAKAEALATLVNETTGQNIVRLGAAVPVPGQLVINATSLGLKESDPLPMSVEHLEPGMTVAEVIAQPEVTPFLEAAKSRGLEIHSGLRMIEGQVGAIADHLCEVWN